MNIVGDAMNTRSANVAIVGGGVIGLSAAHRVVDAGHRVTVFSPQPIESITSSAAAAFWTPYWIGDYDRSIATRTWDRLHELLREGILGISEKTFHEFLTADASDRFDHHSSESHWWKTLAGMDFKDVSLNPNRVLNMPSGTASLVRRLSYKTVVVRMPDYLPWLQSTLLRRECVTLCTQWVDRLDNLLDQYDAVVHCSGWGARYLERDDPATASMRLLAGHAVIVHEPEQHEGELYFGDAFDGAAVYIVPRCGSDDDVLCGGTAIDVTDQVGDAGMDYRFEVEATCRQVIDRVGGIKPKLATAARLGTAFGIRPVRNSVRLEIDATRPRLVHCYGHGGSGLTLSWGSADVAADLLQKALSIAK